MTKHDFYSTALTRPVIIYFCRSVGDECWMSVLTQRMKCSFKCFFFRKITSEHFLTFAGKCIDINMKKKFVCS